MHSMNSSVYQSLSSMCEFAGSLIFSKSWGFVHIRTENTCKKHIKKMITCGSYQLLNVLSLFVCFKIKIWITVASILSSKQSCCASVVWYYASWSKFLLFCYSSDAWGSQKKICLHPTMQHLICMGNLL